MTTKRKGRPAKHKGSLGGTTRKVSLTLPVALVHEIDRQAGDLASRSEAITALLTNAMFYSHRLEGGLGKRIKS